jgi:hypothetical protein
MLHIIQIFFPEVCVPCEHIQSLIMRSCACIHAPPPTHIDRLHKIKN